MTADRTRDRSAPNPGTVEGGVRSLVIEGLVVAGLIGTGIVIAAVATWLG